MPPITNLPPKKPSGQSAQDLEETAVPTEDGAESQQDFARIRRINRIERRFPFLTDLAHEIIAGHGGLITNAFALVAINSDTCDLDKNFRRLHASVDRLVEDADRIDARIDDLAPVFGRVPGVNAAASQIHQPNGTVHKQRPVAERFAVPMRFPNAAVMIRSTTCENDNLVVFRNQKWRERLPDEATATGENDPWFHKAPLP